MRAFRVYMHPRTWRRRVTLFYHRYLAGRGRAGEKLSPVEKQLLSKFGATVANPEAHLAHFVNGVFAKEVILSTEEGTAMFRLVDNSTKVVYLQNFNGSRMVIETFVSARTVLVLNRIFDREFTKMMLEKKENENQFIREIFA